MSHQGIDKFQPYTLSMSNKIFLSIIGKQIKVKYKCFDKIQFEKYKLFTMIKLGNCKHDDVKR